MLLPASEVPGRAGLLPNRSEASCSAGVWCAGVGVAAVDDVPNKPPTCCNRSACSLSCRISAGDACCSADWTAEEESGDETAEEPVFSNVWSKSATPEIAEVTEDMSFAHIGWHSGF